MEEKNMKSLRTRSLRSTPGSQQTALKKIIREHGLSPGGHATELFTAAREQILAADRNARGADADYAMLHKITALPLQMNHATVPRPVSVVT